MLAIGDDRTDEDLFASLPPDAISARVGPARPGRASGSTAPRRCAAVLQMLADAGVRADLA